MRIVTPIRPRVTHGHDRHDHSTAPDTKRHRRPLTMESYIVRIYRREPGDAVTGVAEDTLSRRTVAFRSIAELAEWLRNPSATARKRRARQAPDRGGESS